MSVKRIKAVIVLLLLTVSAAAQRVTVSGYITDTASGETLIASEVVSGESGVVADNDGRYSITIPPGITTLRYYYTGYKFQEITASFLRDTTINVALRAIESLTESRVVAFSETGIRATQMGVMQMPTAVLQRAPVILGEQDVLKTVQLLPGIQQGMDGFSGIFVRGGGASPFLLAGLSILPCLILLT